MNRILTLLFLMILPLLAIKPARLMDVNQDNNISNISGWKTATSLSAGGQYFDKHIPTDFKLEQLFTHQSIPKLTYKIGFYREQLSRLSYSDGAQLNVDYAQNITFGLRYQYLTFMGFFLDAGLFTNYTLSIRTTKIPLFYDPIQTFNYRYQAFYDDPSFRPWIEFGIGYELGRFTLRYDISMAQQGYVRIYKEEEFFINYFNEYQTFARIHSNLSISYWW